MGLFFTPSKNEFSIFSENQHDFFGSKTDVRGIAHMPRTVEHITRTLPRTLTRTPNHQEGRKRA